MTTKPAYTRISGGRGAGNPEASPTIQKILTRHDRGESVAAISRALDLSPGYIYGVLRAERPKRKRTARGSNSPLRDNIAALVKEGKTANEIADKLEITRQCVRKYWPSLKDSAETVRMIKGKHRAGLKATRIAVVLGVSRATVYRHLPKVET